MSSHIKFANVGLCNGTESLDLYWIWRSQKRLHSYSNAAQFCCSPMLSRSYFAWYCDIWCEFNTNSHPV